MNDDVPWRSIPPCGQGCGKALVTRSDLKIHTSKAEIGTQQLQAPNIDERVAPAALRNTDMAKLLVRSNTRQAQLLLQRVDNPLALSRWTEPQTPFG